MPTTRGPQRAGPGEAPASQLARAARTPQRQAGNIRLRLRFVEHHDHGWLLLASDHPCDWSSGREGASGVEAWTPEPAKSKPPDHLDQKGPNAPKPASSRG